MHMADALISPTVGAIMWGATTGIISYSVKKVKKEFENCKVPLMGILGAFIFAAQMINFAIPATGSSGHLGGAMILTILLGPYAAFLTMVSILAVQALFFADGGLLALGCNVFNLGFLPCFIAYPLIYKNIVKGNASSKQIIFGSTLAAIVGLQLGSFGVVLETFLSGIAGLPFTSFLLLMQPVHLAIGLVEGVITATVILFILKERPELAYDASGGKVLRNYSIKPILYSLLAVALVAGGVLSWFASGDPDGLEWSVQKVAGQELGAPEGIHSVFAELQKKIALFPDYNFKDSEVPSSEGAKEKESTWPSVDSGLSIAGIVGSLFSLLIAGSIGKLLKAINRWQQKSF